MAVREHTSVYNANYYWSTFNPHKIFSTLNAAENYEKLYYVEHFKNFHFYRDEDFTEEIKFAYDPQLDYEYYANLGKLEERSTVEPTFTGMILVNEKTGEKDYVEKSLLYFYDEARYLKITADTDEAIPQNKKIKKMNKIISTLNRYWKMDLPVIPGKYKYSKLEGWKRI